MEKELTGTVAVIAGGAGGVGRVTANTLADEGGTVAILDVQAAALPGAALSISCNLRVADEVKEAAQEVVSKLGKVDILVNSVGVYYKGPTEEMPEEEWDRIIDTDLKSYFLCCQVFGKYMIGQKRGRIINIGAIYPSAAAPLTAAYSAAKGAILALTRELAVEWAQFGITVNSVSPGIIDTRIGGQTYSHEVVEQYKAKIPIGRLATHKDIANTVAFLASKGGYITGQDIKVDGGISSIHYVLGDG